MRSDISFWGHQTLVYGRKKSFGDFILEIGIQNDVFFIVNTPKWRAMAGELIVSSVFSKVEFASNLGLINAFESLLDQKQE